jgi:transcriptional regulator with XRE-family HTH domain
MVSSLTPIRRLGDKSDRRNYACDDDDKAADSLLSISTRRNQAATVITVSNTRQRTTGLDLEAEVGRRVRALREAQGLSQQQLGHELASLGFPMEQPTVYKLEKGARPIRINELAALAQVFSVSVQELLPAPDVDPEAGALWMTTMRRAANARDAFNSARHHAQQLAVVLKSARDAEAQAEEQLREAEQAFEEATQRVRGRRTSEENDRG